MNKKILLAEDDRNLGTLLRNYLAAKDYETTLFTDDDWLLKPSPQAASIFAFSIL